MKWLCKVCCSSAMRFALLMATYQRPHLGKPLTGKNISRLWKLKGPRLPNYVSINNLMVRGSLNALSMFRGAVNGYQSIYTTRRNLLGNSGQRQYACTGDYLCRCPIVTGHGSESLLANYQCCVVTGVVE